MRVSIFIRNYFGLFESKFSQSGLGSLGGIGSLNQSLGGGFVTRCKTHICLTVELFQYKSDRSFLAIKGVMIKEIPGLRFQSKYLF